MSDTEVEDDLDASYEADNPEDISLNESALTEDASLNATLDSVATSFSSEPDLTSTPAKKGMKRGQPAQPSSKALPSNFKVPLAPQYVGRCPECQKGLKTLSGLNNHILAHKWKALSNKKPNIEQLEEYCVAQCSSNILKKIAVNRAGGKYGQAFNSYVENLLLKQDSKEWNLFSKLLSKEVCKAFEMQPCKKGERQSSGQAFASGLRSQVQQNINKVLSEKERRDSLIDALFKVEIAATEVAYPFLMMFMQKVGDAALISTFRSMTSRVDSPGQQRQIRSKDNFMSLKSQKLLHYIAGSCVRSHFRHACRHPKNKRLQIIKYLIMNRFVQTPPTVAEKTDRAYWTKTLNRKSLFFVNDNAFEFFLEVTKLLQRMELQDGSIGHESVMDKVVETPDILFKWDMIVGSTLDEDHSFSFMVKVIRTLSNTYGTGILKRRMNMMWKKGKSNKTSISVSHRARVLK